MNKITLYHAEWCGHCVKFMPVWNELVKKIKSDKLDIETVKFEENNIPEEDREKVEGYPTIIINHGNKEYPYEGKRTIEALLGIFGQVGGSKKVKVSKSDEHYKVKYMKYKAKYMELRNTLEN